MKRKTLYVSLIAILVVLIGVISISAMKNGKILSETKEGADSSEIYKDKNIIDSVGITDKLYSEDFSTLVSHSDAVIKGKVKSVEFTSFKGRAWIKLKFHIDNVITGNAKPDTDIDVYFTGGYVSLEEHIKYNDDAFRFEKLSEKEIANTVLREIYDGEDKFIEKDEELILCIVETPDYSALPKGSYERLYSSGMLKLKDGKYTQLYGEVEEKYSIDANKVNDIKKLVSKKSSN